MFVRSLKFTIIVDYVSAYIGIMYVYEAIQQKRYWVGAGEAQYSRHAANPHRASRGAYPRP